MTDFGRCASNMRFNVEDTADLSPDFLVLLLSASSEPFGDVFSTPVSLTCCDLPASIHSCGSAGVRFLLLFFFLASSPAAAAAAAAPSGCGLSPAADAGFCCGEKAKRRGSVEKN
jgi:hypothetical protein